MESVDCFKVNVVTYQEDRTANKAKGKYLVVKAFCRLLPKPGDKKF